MTVVNPKSISGINSITMASGSDDLLTIHSNNTTERVRVNNSGDVIIGSGVTLSPDGDGFFTGVITATSYSGIDLSDVTGATGDFSIADKIVHTGDTNTTIRFPAADTITAETAGSERIRLDSDGHFGVGTNNPTSQVDIHCGTDNTGLQITSTDAGAFASYYDNTGASTIGHQGTDLVLSADPAGSVGSSKISFQVDSNTERATIDSTGDLTISDGDLVIGTAGHGIDFSSASGSASGSTSALLDDYEEGTFTPVMHSNSGGGANASYSAQSGRYTKIGRIVHIRYDIQWTGWTNASGQLNVDNLPFVNEGVGSSGGYGAPQVRDPSGVDSNIRIYGNSSYIGNSLNRIRLLAYNSSGTEVSCTAQSSGRMTGEAIMYVSV